MVAGMPRAESVSSAGDVENREGLDDIFPAVDVAGEKREEPLDPDTSIIVLSVKTKLPNIGVHMDLANKHANEWLQEGKGALEASKNMNTKLKQTAADSLQLLYESVLSLSDSRHRNKAKMEELLRLQSIQHSRTLERMTKECNNRLNSFMENMEASWQTTIEMVNKNLTDLTTNRAVEWLEFETREPYRQIKEMDKAIKNGAADEEQKSYPVLRNPRGPRAGEGPSAGKAELKGG